MNDVNFSWVHFLPLCIISWWSTLMHTDSSIFYVSLNMTYHPFSCPLYITSAPWYYSSDVSIIFPQKPVNICSQISTFILCRFYFSSQWLKRVSSQSQKNIVCFMLPQMSSLKGLFESLCFPSLFSPFYFQDIFLFRKNYIW